jgi:hypothetical protein
MFNVELNILHISILMILCWENLDQHGEANLQLPLFLSKVEDMAIKYGAQQHLRQFNLRSALLRLRQCKMLPLLLLLPSLLSPQPLNRFALALPFLPLLLLNSPLLLLQPLLLLMFLCNRPLLKLIRLLLPLQLLLLPRLLLPSSIALPCNSRLPPCSALHPALFGHLSLVTKIKEIFNLLIFPLYFYFTFLTRNILSPENVTCKLDTLSKNK